MSINFEVAITFIVYLLFFAWLGYLRGYRAEMAVFLTGLLGWIALELFGDVVVRVANLGGKFFVFAASGGLGASGDDAFRALADAPDVITAANRESFLFVIWVILVVIAYVVSSNRAARARRRSAGAVPLTPGAFIDTLAGVMSGRGPASAPPDAGLRGWAAVVGMANGLLFASVFLPRLLALMAPDWVAYYGIPESAGPFSILVAGFQTVFYTIRQLWQWIQPQASWVLLVLLTLFLVLAANTLRGGSGSANAKS
jgi:hypothetical protein